MQNNTEIIKYKIAFYSDIYRFLGVYIPCLGDEGQYF